MVIRSIRAENVRNHRRTDLACAPHVNILSGRNGAGKTSLLEAISLCTMARSFVPVPDSALVTAGAGETSMTLTAERDGGIPYRVSVSWKHGGRKRFVSTIADSLTARDIIGEMPVVALSPDHKSITFGGPADRRSFLDAVMAQASNRYRDLLFDHRRLLKQRNAVLAMANGNPHAVGPEIGAWTEAFVTTSADIVVRRRDFLADLAPRVLAAYLAVSGGAETVGMAYEADHVEADALVTDAGVHQALAQTAARLRDAEARRGVTLFGPQKDDVVLTIGDGLVRETASQGQHKSLLVALKLAECDVLLATTGERPVVLLDDVFSELDRFRCAHVMQRLLSMGMQCFVTTTDGAAVADMLPAGTDCCVVSVDAGRIIDERRYITGESNNDGALPR